MVRKTDSNIHKTSAGKQLSNVDQAGCSHQVHTLVQMKVELEVHVELACLSSMINIMSYGAAELARCLVALCLGSTAYLAAMEIMCTCSLQWALGGQQCNATTKPRYAYVMPPMLRHPTYAYITIAKRHSTSLHSANILWNIYIGKI